MGNNGRISHPQAKSAPAEGDKEATLLIPAVYLLKTVTVTATPLVPLP